MQKQHRNHGRDHLGDGEDPIPFSAVWPIKVFEDDEVNSVGNSSFVFAIPEELDGWALVSAHSFVSTAASSGTVGVQIRNVTDGVDMLQAWGRLWIDEGEYTSYTADEPAVINADNAVVATGDRIAIDVDVAGVGAKGLGVILTFRRQS